MHIVVQPAGSLEIGWKDLSNGTTDMRQAEMQKALVAVSCQPDGCLSNGFGTEHIVIAGTNLGWRPGYVAFRGLPCEISKWADVTIECSVEYGEGTAISYVEVQTDREFLFWDLVADVLSSSMQWRVQIWSVSCGIQSCMEDSAYLTIEVSNMFAI